MLQNARSRRQSIPLAGQSVHVNPGEGRPFLFSFSLFWESVHKNARCIGLGFAADFIWPSGTQYCVPSFFCFLDLASPSISLVLQSEVKSRMAPL